MSVKFSEFMEAHFLLFKRQDSDQARAFVLSLRRSS